MFFSGYLAMTAGEIAAAEALPERLAYMACHFSPYGLGLSNLPRKLPPKSLLMLNDRTPICGHDPSLVVRQLRSTIEQLDCAAVVLDFQKPGAEEVVKAAQALPCPVCVTPEYAPLCEAAVLLPPVPPDTPPDTWLSQYPGRQIWLEIAPTVMAITVEAGGASAVNLPPYDAPKEGHADQSLFCHYQIQVQEDAAVFTLFRTREDLMVLTDKALSLGASQLIGLYQEFL